MQKRKCAVNWQIFKFSCFFGRASRLSEKPEKLRTELDYHFLNNNKFKKKLLNAYHAYIRVTDDNKYLLVKFKMICISSKQAINMATLVFSTNATIDNENRNVKPKSQNNDIWKSR